MSQDICSKVVREEVIFKGKWLGLKYVDFSIGDKTIKNYEKVFRTTSKEGVIEGIDIVPIIKYKEKKT